MGENERKKKHSFASNLMELVGQIDMTGGGSCLQSSFLLSSGSFPVD
jgi:hypothetical protein